MTLGSTPWNLRLFGGLSVENEGRQIARLRAQKYGALLAYLALHPQRAHTREELIDLFWPEADLDAGRSCLRTALASLRRQFARPNAGGPTAADILLTDGNSTIRINRAIVTTDIARFEFCLARARALGPDAASERATLLGEAVELYVGPLLPGVYDDWAIARREELADAFEKAKDQLESLGGPPLAPRPPRLSAGKSAAVPTSDTSLLPLATDGFYGRETELAHLTELFADSGAAVVTLTGPGGSGKTRLALEVARRLSGRLRVRAVFVSCASVSEATLLPQAVASALGLVGSATDGGAVFERTIAHIGALATNGPLLLVLDNLEHLVGDEETVRFVCLLAGRVPDLLLLLTSRQRLRLEGEREVAVGPLPLPPQHSPSQETPEQILSSAAVRLFADRARRVLPDWAVTRRNAVAVSTLCRHLEGIPLALELCAAWIHELTPSQMLARLESDRFSLLSSRPGYRSATRSGSPTSLHAALSSSYTLLPANAQRLFAHFSVFRGGADVDAVRTVCVPENDHAEAQALLETLADRSLLIRPASDGRWTILATLREFAAEQLVDEEVATTTVRHALHFCEQAEARRPQLSGPDQADALDYLETNHDNLRTALHWCGRTAERSEIHIIEIGLRIAAALGQFWLTRGHLTEGRHYTRQALSNARFLPSTPEQKRRKAVAETFQARMAHYQSAFAEAQECLTRAQTIYESLGAEAEVASVLNTLGNVLRTQGKTEEAQAAYGESLRRKRAINDSRGIAVALNNLGLIACDRGEYTEARVYWEESLAIKRILGEPRGIASGLHNLGMAALGMGDRTAGRRYFEEALDLRRDISDCGGIANSLVYLAPLLCREGKTAAGQRAIAECFTLLEESGDSIILAFALEQAAEMAHLAADWSRLVSLLSASERFRREIGAPLGDYERTAKDAFIRTVQEACNSTQFTRAWSVGENMSLAEAIALARHAEEPPAYSLLHLGCC